jgi:hypothetical protein
VGDQIVGPRGLERSAAGAEELDQAAEIAPVGRDREG